MTALEDPDSRVMPPGLGPEASPTAKGMVLGRLESYPRIWGVDASGEASLDTYP